MVRSNVRTKKSSKKFVRKGGLTRELDYRKKVLPVKHKMQDAAKRKEQRGEDELRKEEEEHIEDLRRLEELDPDLVAHVKRHDPDLLEFAEGQVDDAEEEEEEEEEEGAQQADEQAAAPATVQSGPTELTSKMVSEWFKTMIEGKSQRGLRRSVTALRAAADQGFLGDGQNPRHIIRDAVLFEYIVITAAGHVPPALNHHLGRKRGAGDPSKCEAWPQFQGIVRGYVGAMAKLLMSRNLPDAVAAQLLRNAGPAIDYLAPFPSIARHFLKGCLGACAHDSEAIRVLAFVVVRDLAKPGRLPPPFTDACMKGMYLTFVQNGRAFDHSNYAMVSFLINQCVELCGVDLSAAYQHVFVYVRQLAVYLRAALQSGAGEEAFRQIYNWQYVNSLRLWAMAVAMYNDKRELFPLVYPIAQIACGVVELFPAPKTFPLHLLVLGILNHLQRRTGVYVPTSLYLLRILSSPVFTKKYSTSSDNRAPDLAFCLRAKKGDMSNGHYHFSVLSEALYLLLEHLSLHAHSIGFPELVFPVVTRLRKLRKEIGKTTPKWGGAVTQLLQKVEQSRAWSLERRRNVDFGPSDSEKVAGWEAAAKESTPPLVSHHAAEKKKRDEQRRMRAEAEAGPRARKTIDEAADDASEESLAGLAQAEDDDVASEDAKEDAPDFGVDPGPDEPADPESEATSRPRKRRRRSR